MRRKRKKRKTDRRQFKFPFFLQCGELGKKDFHRRGNMEKVINDFAEYMDGVYRFNWKKFVDYLYGKKKGVAS